MQILIQTDPANRVPKDVSAAERDEWARKFTIYDVGTNGQLGAAYGPTDPDAKQPAAAGLAVVQPEQAGSRRRGLLPATAAAEQAMRRRPVRMVVFGSSTDAQNYVVLSGDLTVSNGIATWVSTEGTHEIGTGTICMLGQPDPAAGVQSTRLIGPVTRTSSTAVTMVATGAPNGGPVNCRLTLLSAYAPQSWVRELQVRLGGSLEVINWAFGGETTARGLIDFDQVLALRPDIICGAWKIGNDLLQGISEGTVSRLTQMIEAATSRGIYCLISLPPAVPDLLVGMDGKGRVIAERVKALASVNPLVLVHDEFPDTVLPNTGQGNPSLFRDAGGGDPGIHANHRGAIIRGQRVADMLLPLIGTVWDKRISSVFDRRSANADSYQLMDGFFLGTGTAASTLDGKATGTVDAGFTDIVTAGNASRAVACSLVDRADGVGKDQVFAFTAAAAGDQLSVELTNAVGAEFWRSMTAGTVYEAVCDLSITLASGATVTGYEHYINVTVNGQNARRTENMRTSGAEEDTPLAVDISEPMCHFPPFALEAAPTAAKWKFDQQAETTGVITIKIGRPTLRAVRRV